MIYGNKILRWPTILNSIIGLPVWMDVKGGVTGNINSAMAAGVENAAVICPFMTEAYEQSESCQLELCYAKDRKVQVLR